MDVAPVQPVEPGSERVEGRDLAVRQGFAVAAVEVSETVVRSALEPAVELARLTVVDPRDHMVDIALVGPYVALGFVTTSSISYLDRSSERSSEGSSS